MDNRSESSMNDEKFILTSANATTEKHYVVGKSLDGFSWSPERGNARRFRDRAELNGWLANLRWGQPGPEQLKGHSGIGLAVERA